MIIKCRFRRCKEEIFLNGEDVNSIAGIFDDLISRNEQIEKEQEEFRKKEIELIGHLNYRLEKRMSPSLYGYIKITPRNSIYFNLFRKGSTLEQLGKGERCYQRKSKAGDKKYF